MSSKGIPGDKNGSNPTWSHNQAFGTHFMIFSQFSRGSKHYIIYLSIFQKTILGMIIFNVTIDSAIMAKLTNLGIIRCSAEDNWPKDRATPGKENLEEEGNFNLLVEKSGNKKSSDVLSCLEYEDERDNEHIDGNDSDQEWQGDGMLKDWEGGWREGERARDPRPILKKN